jgi:hypothetical protein
VEDGPHAPDFNLCHLRARLLAERLYNSSKAPEICFGAYHPTTPIYMWDMHWQKLYIESPTFKENGFLHFWVECKNRIWDISLQQFGIKRILIAPLYDFRYTKYGIENPLTKNLIHFHNSPKVLWEEYPFDRRVNDR